MGHSIKSFGKSDLQVPCCIVKVLSVISCLVEEDMQELIIKTKDIMMDSYYN